MKIVSIAAILAFTVSCSSKKEQPDTPAPKANDEAPAPKANDEAPADSAPAAQPPNTRALGTTVEAGKSLMFMSQERGGDTPVKGPIRWESKGRVASLEYKAVGDEGEGSVHVTVDGKEVAKLDVTINLAYDFDGFLQRLASGDLLVSAHDSGGGQDEGTEYRYLLTWDGANLEIAREWTGTGMEEVPTWAVGPKPSPQP